MLGQCKGSAWRADDFSRCLRHDFFQTLIPLILCAISALWLALQLLRAWWASRAARAGYTRVKHDGIYNGYDGTRDTYGDGDGDGDGDDDDDDGGGREAEPARQEETDVYRSQSRANADLVVIDRPKGERWITLVEELAVLALLGVHVAALLLKAWGRKGDISAIAGVAVWAYIAVLTSIRLLFTGLQRRSFPQIWYHTTALYCSLWIPGVLLFRSEIIHPDTASSTILMSTSFALNSLLALIALSSRPGNRPVEMVYEGDLKPSREPLASVLSLITFSWVDAIVWAGYRKTSELRDVWNLPLRDQAASILVTYRQLKKTNSLVFHLVKYFKKELTIQAAWAAVSGLIIFVPTLLLKAILEYVEDPMATPRSAAWFYVMLLFVSGLVNALASGQALWLGRKITIRLRAIIIGEIYAKALRRRAAASPDKVLGEKKKDHDEPKQGMVKKALTFGKKKKKKQSDSESTAEQQTASDESQVTSGAIINLMAVDSFKVSEIGAYLHFLWGETPVLFVVAIVLLYEVLGNSSIVGIGMMALLLPMNMIVAKKFTQIQTRILAATDARIHTTNEVLTNIRIIKYFAWEQRFLATVDEKRKVELDHLWHRYVVWATAATIWSGAPIVISFLTFLFYTVVEKKDLIPSVAFTALSLFNLLRIPLDQLADMVAHVQESIVSVNRVEEYLSEPETDKYKQLQHGVHDEDGEPLIGFDGATFSWGGRDGDDFKMIELDIHFQVGQLNVVTGPTGSGKTSLLMALLGEMTLLEGQVFLPGGHGREELEPHPETGLTESVAYCAQQAWLLNGTIKENILFAGKWDARRYKDVIKACSLQRDLEILDSGDQTLVGEKGVTLSGGQKQRISLARALYSTARHVLMDDVLSAVDSHTAKWIFDKAILGPLMRDRTCVLVTHNAALCLPLADFAVALENGRVATQGTAVEVMSSGKLAEDMSKFESRPASRGTTSQTARADLEATGDESAADQLTVEQHTAATGNPLRTRADSDLNPLLNGNTLTKIVSKDIPGMNKMVENDVQNEKKATGAVKLSIMTMYLGNMGGWFYWTVAALCFALQQVSQVATNVWIRQWANAYDRNEAIAHSRVNETSSLTHIRGSVGSSFACLGSGSCAWNIPFSVPRNSGVHVSVLGTEVDVGYYLGVYAALGVAYMLITFTREIVLFAGSLSASKRVHRTLMESITHAKFRFFDSTPLGQIMNRFSKDIEAVDQEIAPGAVGLVHCLASILTIVVLISVITPGFLIAAAFISILYYLIGMFYINSSRDLKRIESVQRSPLFQQFGETLSGMTTIRAYGDERRFIRENLLRINTHSRPFIYLWASNRWLSFRVDVTGALVSFFTGAFVILSVGRVDAGAAGLAMTYAVTFTENVLWFVRLYASNEQNMNAVERVKEYLDVDQEAASIVPDHRPEPDWPSKGAVEFSSYSTRYRRDFDFVLKRISFKILPGEKVGVVGRTGAGKSSLALALFRALEAEEGAILVDDVDIGQIGLQDLRENIVMVPQDPTLFTGTIRSNLDPFGLFTDEDIFTALQRVQLIGAATPTTPSRPETPMNQTSQSSPTTTVSRHSVSKSSSPTHASSATFGTESSVLENKNIFLNLSTPVAESGSNLSQGQRQLLCLARAMLKSPKVLLMDEATASIDYATDAKIQETIREIKNTTITIAHRLQTIIDYDKVMVLERGELVEYGDPFDLVSKEGGIFHGMCQMTDDFDVLFKEAKKAHDARRLVDDD